MSYMNFESIRLFPTVIAIGDHTFDKNVIAKSQKILEEFGRTDSFLCPCTTTIRDFNQILEEKEFNEIKTIIVEFIKKYCDFWNYNTEQLQITESWLNSYKSNEFQDLHHHHNSVFSGVFYLKSDGSEDFVIQSPWYQKQPILIRTNDVNQDNMHHYVFPSTVGRCYIFPSYLLHRTLPAKSERISLSFNCRY